MVATPVIPEPAPAQTATPTPEPPAPARPPIVEPEPQSQSLPPPAPRPERPKPQAQPQAEVQTAPEPEPEGEPLSDLEKRRQEFQDWQDRLAELEAAEKAERERQRAERQERIEQGLPVEPITPRRRTSPLPPPPVTKTLRPDEIGGTYSTGALAAYMPYADVDQDGVPNVHDHCPDVPGRPAFNGCPEDDPRGLPVSAQADPEIDAFARIYFETGEAYLDGKARIALNEVYRYLAEHPYAQLVVMGHADYVGSDPLNDALSQRRCEAVVAYLKGRGIAPNRLRIEFYGERLPAASNETEAGRQRNRRVELVLEAPAELPAED